jgi:hypothetical protein
MKIYIDEKWNPAKLLNFVKSKQMEEYLVDKINIINIYSKEGIYEVNENNTYKVYITSEESENKIIDNVNCIIYKSVVDKKLVYQLPNEHINVPTLILKYSANLKLPFKLVIECVNVDNLKPIDYYFEIDPKIEYNISNFVQDSSVFLSLLN